MPNLNVREEKLLLILKAFRRRLLFVRAVDHLRPNLRQAQGAGKKRKNGARTQMLLLYNKAFRQRISQKKTRLLIIRN